MSNELFSPVPAFLGDTLVIEVNPGGAGVDPTTTIADGNRLELRSVYFDLVTDVTVVNRFPVLEVVRSTDIIHRIQVALAQTASLSKEWYLAPSVEPGATIARSFLTWPIPPNIDLIAGDILRVDTLNLQAGDQVNFMRAVFRRWINPTA